MPIDLRRIAVAPLPLPGPHFLAGILSALPIWALTSQQKELRLSLAGLLLAQGQAQPDCAAAAKGLLAYAGQIEPFDAPSLALLTQTQAQAPFLPPRAAAMANLLAGMPQLADDDVSYEAIAASGDADLFVRYLEVSCRDRVAGLARLAPAFAGLCRLPDLERAEGLLAGFAPVLPPSLFARLAAEFAVLRLPPELALTRLATLDADVWGLFVAVATSHCLDRLGDREGALTACLTARRALPYHVNLTLRASELAKPVAVPPPAKAGEAAVCLYSLNKAELFYDCLTHLAATDLGEVVVAILDNGSTDATPDMLAGMAARFPSGRFVSVRLPVNIGAPGARNWLLALPEVAVCSHVAFLDDDEEAPPTWLAELLDAQRRFDADVVFGAVRGRAPDGQLTHRAYFEDFFSRKGPAEAAVTRDYHGCGCSLVRRAALPDPVAPFSPARNQTGGEDDLLFAAMRDAGARFAWAPEAWVWEDPAPARLTLGYAVARAFVYGQGPTYHCATSTPPDVVGVARWMAIGLGQTGVYGLVALLKWLAGAPDRAFALDRAARGLGKVLWWGPFKLRLYGQVEAPKSSG